MVNAASASVATATTTASDGASTSAREVRGFRLLTMVTTALGVRVTRYRSRRTGLTATFVDVDRAVVRGYFVLGTEESGVRSNSGLPHTLEHLIFHGSKDYPYKGILDIFANLAFASGTNAWTEKDHTCYTLSTAGAEGFESILPIYLDHILFPTLPEPSFVTEIYHISVDGEDSGVVFSEMQGVENTEEALSERMMLRTLYSEGCGYASETGGIMQKIRWLTLEDIKEYHTEFYRPENLCVIIIGKFSHANMLDILGGVDEKILSKLSLAPFVRPWTQHEIPDFKVSETKTVEFPDEDESTGGAKVAYCGPAILEFEEREVLSTILAYLTDSPISLLAREFSEIEDAYCTSVDAKMFEFSKTAFSIEFEAVPIDKLLSIAPKLEQVLAAHNIDMNRMDQVIKNLRLNLMQEFETDPAGFLIPNLITDFLYGDPEGKSTGNFCSSVDELNRQMLMSAADWTEIYRKYLVGTPRVCVISRPSAQLVTDLAAEDGNLVSVRRRELGPRGLAGLKANLDLAIEFNARVPPDYVLSRFPKCRPIYTLPIVYSARVFHSPLASQLNDESLLKAIQSIGDALPFPVCIDSVDTEFITIMALFDTRCLGAQLIQYLELYRELLFTSGVQRLGVADAMNFADVRKLVEEIFVTYDCSSGLDGSLYHCGQFESQFIITVKVHPEDYTRGVRLLQELTLYLVPDMAQVLIAAKKIKAEIPQCKRDGDKICSWLARASLFKESSPQFVQGIIYQENFLKGLIPQLAQKKPGAFDDLLRLRSELFQAENFRLSLTGNFKKLFAEAGGPEKVMLPWMWFFRDTPVDAGKPSFGEVKFDAWNKQNVPHAVEELRTNKRAEPPLAFCVGVPSIESGYFYAYVYGPSGFYSDELPALLLAIEYLNMIEGPLWKAVRGPGLAYGLEVAVDLSSGLVYFSVYRSAKLAEVWLRSRDVVRKESVRCELDGHCGPEVYAVRSAKSSLIYRIISGLDSPHAMARAIVVNQLMKRVLPGYEQQLIDKIDAVRMNDMRDQIRDRILPIFENKAAFVVASCNIKVAKRVCKELNAAGVPVLQHSLW